MPSTTNSATGRASKGALLLSSMLCGGLQLAAFGGSAANAQTAPSANAPASEGVQEVVVTAERRSETVKNVPMSITAISSATATKFDIQDLTDYAQLTPIAGLQLHGTVTTSHQGS